MMINQQLLKIRNNLNNKNKQKLNRNHKKINNKIRNRKYKIKKKIIKNNKKRYFLMIDIIHFYYK